jgi:imidazolonepropionase-like amidohydrolase
VNVIELQTAEILEIADETGGIEPGKYADFVVMDKNPLKEISALAKPSMVSIGGHLIDKPEIKPI